jgi:hypothetical protein
MARMSEDPISYYAAGLVESNAPANVQIDRVRRFQHIDTFHITWEVVARKRGAEKWVTIRETVHETYRGVPLEPILQKLLIVSM